MQKITSKQVGNIKFNAMQIAYIVTMYKDLPMHNVVTKDNYTTLSTKQIIAAMILHCHDPKDGILVNSIYIKILRYGIF